MLPFAKTISLPILVQYIGLASIWFSKHIKKPYSLEPSLTTFKILKTNLAIASATNVDADNTDGGSKDGK